MAAISTQQTFVEALNVMNAVIEANRSSTPFRQILRACDSYYAGKNLGVAVYKDDPDTPHDYFTIRLEDGVFVLVEHGKKQPDIAWKVPENYLREVADNPRYYLDHPLKLSLDWLTRRLKLRKSSSTE